MPSIVAPLSYERYAVLVSPLLVPDVVPATAKPSPRQVERVGPVSPASPVSRRADSHAGAVSQGSVSQSVRVSQGSSVQSSTRPQHGPPPSDDKNFLALPVHAVGSARGQTIPDPRKIVMLYEPSEDTLGQSLHIAV